jgi:hypothetical protein
MYRCDDFTKTHNEKHVVFIGDSFACGDGLEKEDTWCYKVYKEMSKDAKLSGYYNLGMSGASITECIDQFFKYCGTYTNPDVVFFITTEIDRDLRYTTVEQQDFFIHRMYYYLDLYCKSNNIELYSFSWLKSSGMIKDQPKRYTWKVNGIDVLRPLWTEQVSNQKQLYNIELLKDFDSFYDYSSKEMIDAVYEFDNKTEIKTKSLWADDGVHPGTSFHDFYAKFIYNKYLENK